MTQLATLSRLTHLEMGAFSEVLALAPLLPDLQSLALNLRSQVRSASAADAANRLNRCPMPGLPAAKRQCSAPAAVS